MATKEGGGNNGDPPKDGDAMEVENEILTDEVKAASADELKQRIRLLDNDIRVMKSETQRLKHEVGRGVRDAGRGRSAPDDLFVIDAKVKV